MSGVAGPPPRAALFDAYPHLLGGAQHTLLTLADELASRGEPPVVVVPGDGPLVAAARERSITVDIVTLPRALGRFGRATTGRHAVAATAALPVAWARLRAAFARSGVAIVHANDHRGALLAAPAARAAGRPVVWHAHSVDVDGGAIERTIGRVAGAVVAPSHAALTELRSLPARTTTAVVGAAVDPAVRALGLARRRGEGRIVLAARLHPAKGVDVAVRAVAELASRGRTVLLDVFGGEQRGDEAYAAEVHALPGALGIDELVRFHGQVASPHAEWLDADVYVQPSRAETFGMAAAEAMALGLPVVVTAVGGMPELVEHGASGVVVAPDDPVALADGLELVLADPARAATLADAAARRAAEFTPDRLADAVIGVWRRVLAPRDLA